MSKPQLNPLIIIGTLFFAFGLLTWVNGILIPYFKICLELNNFESTWVAFASYTAYFVMALPSAWILKHTGYKKGMFVGLMVMAAGALLFIPAAYTRAYGLFLTGLFVTGSGLALVQTAANPYLSILGSIESHARRVGFMGLANKTAGLISLAVFGSIFLLNADSIIVQLQHADALQREAMLNAYVLRVVKPYLIVTVLLILLALTVYYSSLPDIQEEDTTAPGTKAGFLPPFSKFPHLWFGVLSLFCAGACEVIPIDGIILYSKALGKPIAESRHFAQYTVYAMIVGYLSSTVLIPRYLSQQKALCLCSVYGMIMALAALFSQGITSVVFVMLLGFSASMLWGTIWGLSLKNMGRFTKSASALLLMSVIGGGIFPMIFGALIDMNRYHPQMAILLLLPCYLIILCFATWGYKWKGTNRELNENSQ